MQSLALFGHALLLSGIGARDPLTYLGLSVLAATRWSRPICRPSSDKSRSDGRLAFRLILPDTSEPDSPLLHSCDEYT